MLNKISFAQEILNNRDFSGETFVEINFSNTILNNCNFNNATFVDCNFSGAEMHDCSFDNSRIRNTNFLYAVHNIKRHRIACVKMENCTFRNAVILYCDFYFKGRNVDFSGTKFGKCNFLSSELENVNLTYCKIKYFYAEDTCFIDCDFNDCTPDKSEFEECDIISKKDVEISYCEHENVKVS